MTIGNRIKAIRAEKNFTQEDLSEFSLLSTVTISGIENGHTKIYLETALKIADALGVSLNWLATGNGDKNIIL